MPTATRRPCVDGQLSLWDVPDRSPTWDDVAHGRAVLVGRVVPCDRCETHWRHGRCDNTPDRYQFPMSRGDGTCRQHFVVWPMDVRPGDVIERDEREDER